MPTKTGTIRTEHDSLLASRRSALRVFAPLVGCLAALALSSQMGCQTDCGVFDDLTIEGLWTRASDAKQLHMEVGYKSQFGSETETRIYQLCPNPGTPTALIRYDSASGAHLCNVASYSVSGNTRSFVLGGFDQTICAAAEKGCGEDPATLSASPPDDITGTYTMMGCGP